VSGNLRARHPGKRASSAVNIAGARAAYSVARRVFELFKVLGSLAGFCSFGFLVWDRITRHRPVVAPTVIYADDKPHVPERYGLIVTNPSE
jgi:hypothetical protein